MQSFLQKFSYLMTLVHRLHTFCRRVKQTSSPHTYQCFAEGIRQCLEPFHRFVLAKERQVNELDQLVHPVTIANLFHEMQEHHFATILHLYKIYQNVTLDFNQYSGEKDDIRAKLSNTKICSHPKLQVTFVQPI